VFFIVRQTATDLKFWFHNPETVCQYR